MTRRIDIEPVTRVEGHAHISIHLDAAGAVEKARLHVNEFRGFEQFCVGRPIWEMPTLTARVCGICPISHMLAAAKAGDAILAVAVPQPAIKLRRLINLAQIVQSHALSFFHLSAPDLLLGMESDPAQRNLFGLIAAEPELARGGIRLRQFGQEIIAMIGGQRVHPAWAEPGGVRSGLPEGGAALIRNQLPEMFEIAAASLKRFKQLLDRYGDEIDAFNIPGLFMGLVDDDGQWEVYDGRLRFVDSDGDIVADRLDPVRYRNYIGENSEPWSYMKFPYYRPHGYPGGGYRVGPLARLNVCSAMGTPLADHELKEYRERGGRVASSSFFYHYARLIEITAALERIGRLCDDAELAGGRLRASAGINNLEGVGVSEAPRGTLFHHYRVDQHGLVTEANLLIATGQNNLAINRSLTQIARRYIQGEEIAEGALNRVEAGLRAFDPCLSCATHAAGQMPLVITLVSHDGHLLDEVKR